MQVIDLRQPAGTTESGSDRAAVAGEEAAAPTGHLISVPGSGPRRRSLWRREAARGDRPLALRLGDPYLAGAVAVLDQVEAEGLVDP